VHTTEHVAAVTHELNTRPRKSLGYNTPQARFQAETRRCHKLTTAVVRSAP
jgi:transposase, IS30 family